MIRPVSDQVTGLSQALARGVAEDLEDPDLGFSKSKNTASSSLGVTWRLSTKSRPIFQKRRQSWFTRWSFCAWQDDHWPLLALFQISSKEKKESESTTIEYKMRHDGYRERVLDWTRSIALRICSRKLRMSKRSLLSFWQPELIKTQGWFLVRKVSEIFISWKKKESQVAKARLDREERWVLLAKIEALLFVAGESGIRVRQLAELLSLPPTGIQQSIES